MPETIIDLVSPCPHLPLLFRDEGEADDYKDLKCDSYLAELDNSEDMKTRDAVMREVAEWLELETRDLDQGLCRSQLRTVRSLPKEFCVPC